jgi:uncharacterized membrane protein
MNGENPRSTAQLMGHPIHPMLVPFPIAFFISAFVTDLLFLRSGEPVWAEASVWLLGAGVGMAALAALAGLIDFLGDRRIRALRDAWMHMLGNIVAVAIEAVNLLLRLDDPGFTGSIGIILSALVVAILAFTGWKGGELVFRHRVGVQERGPDGRPG